MSVWKPIDGGLAHCSAGVSRVTRVTAQRPYLYENMVALKRIEPAKRQSAPYGTFQNLMVVEGFGGPGQVV